MFCRIGQLFCTIAILARWCAAGSRVCWAVVLAGAPHASEPAPMWCGLEVVRVSVSFVVAYRCAKPDEPHIPVGDTYGEAAPHSASDHTSSRWHSQNPTSPDASLDDAHPASRHKRQSVTSMTTSLQHAQLAYPGRMSVPS